MNYVEIFPDGSCQNNGRENAIGGWAFVVTHPNKTSVAIECFGKLREGDQTNNRSELESIYQALKWVDTHCDGNTIYTFYSDSEIAIKGIKGESGRNANRDIWIGIENLCKKLVKKGALNTKSFKNVEAHVKNSDTHINQLNNLADRLAKQGANSLLLEPVKI